MTAFFPYRLVCPQTDIVYIVYLQERCEKR